MLHIEHSNNVATGYNYVYMHIGCMNKLTDFWSSIEAADKVRCDIIVTDKAGRSKVTEL